MPTFEELLADPACSLAVDDQGSDLALVAFGGLKGKLAIPPFEFFGLTRNLPVTKIFIRDQAQAWYVDGVPELGPDLRSAAQGARELVDSLARDAVLFGTSAGGFAAMAVGVMGGFQTVHAFGAQVSMRRKVRAEMGDRRWMPRARALWRSEQPDKVLDVRPLLDASDGHTSVNVHVANDELDIAHAALIEGRPGVTVHRHPKGGHSFVRRLRVDGSLERLVRDSLGLEPAP
ncbi:hypothetical protein GCM10009795_000470 [Nocardioides hankookensis]|uniref:Peptidase S9 prolyl oligopeptidase catalytic domain-containing protein n=1 Tax=Nocardioides hankookensis TaxID=443157 RepID=A0ABW1LKI0_9ACTN